MARPVCIPASSVPRHSGRTLGCGIPMTIRHQCLLISRAVAMLMPGGLGWLIYEAAAYLVHHSSIEISLYHAGFGFVSNGAEMVCALGPAASVAAGLLFGLLGTLVYLRQVGSFVKAVALDFLVAVIVLCGVGSGFLFPLPAVAALLLWAAAVVWVVMYAVRTAN